MKESAKRIQLYISLTSYFFLSFAIFNPVFTQENISVNLFFCFLTASLTAFCIFFLYVKSPFSLSESSFFHRSFAVLVTIISVFSVLLLMTQVIKDTCYIAGKGVSKYYYIMLSLAVLAVSLYLCFNSEKGMYRFCFMSVIPIFLFIVSALLPYFTVKGIVFDLNNTRDENLSFTIIHGCISGLFFAFDSSLFIYCFKDCFKADLGFVRSGVASLISSFILWCICITGVYLIFGKNLTVNLNDPLYALTKSFHGFDMTEALSALRLFAFIIKSSVYLYSCSLCIKKAFFPSQKHALKIILPVVFALIPLIYLPFVFLSQKGYGTLQGLIYPCVIILSLIFTFFIILRKKDC